ncbi:hypothetical protein [Bacillus sp. EB01]|uniref:hypothetical protein n=1 Tax=Bacillus sp. EB01 TaxID=1347086 RepID=UPI0005C4FA6F|nr:hypothetical protein [Bacillus sp. EB01]
MPKMFRDTRRQGNVKKNIEINKRKKEALNEKFLTRVQIKDKAIKLNDKSEDLKQIKEIHKKLKKAQKEIEAQKKLIHELREENRLEKQKNESLKREKWELQKELNLETKRLEIKTMELHTSLQKEIKQTKELELQLDLLKKEKRRKRVSDKQKNLANQVKQLREQNTALKQKLDNFDSIVIQEHGDLREELAKLQRELDTYKVFENNLRSNPELLISYFQGRFGAKYLPQLLLLLEQYISKENLKYFYLEGQNVFYTFMRRVGLLGHLSKKRASPYILRNPKYFQESERLGYLAFEDGEWMFTDLTTTAEINSFPVKDSSVIPSDSTDLPARARVQEGVAEITRLYSWFEFNPTSNVQKVSRKASKQKEYKTFGNFKILIVGSRLMNNYMSRLEKHGCLVQVHNPYEDGFELLKGRVGRAEIILVCERHVPHNVWDYIDRRQPYVSVLKKDSADLISTYTYLTLQRCELI